MKPSFASVALEVKVNKQRNTYLFVITRIDLDNFIKFISHEHVSMSGL